MKDADGLQKCEASMNEKVEIPPSLIEKRRKHCDLHPLNTNNPHTENLAKGLYDPSYVLNPRQMLYSLIQWRAFSQLFPAIQAEHMVRAPTKARRQKARDILVNETGVAMNLKTMEVEGNHFSHSNAHIEWIEPIIEKLAPVADEMKICIDTENPGKYLEAAGEKTKLSMKGLRATYGSEDGFVGAAASEEIERWAGRHIGTALDSKNFWSQEIIGCNLFERKYGGFFGITESEMLKFFVYHKRLELGHVAAVEETLAELIQLPGFNEDTYIEGGVQALNAMLLFFQDREDGRLRYA